ncbi:hypothetical protein BDV38DRAFT_274004 [Aspergillus pseudotamarii]|uniref:S-adenosyl-L-methionine-dependent methyltransferase n=1 Tax=Aspergillus pseudotamarii TaxID=132259 RepID=A0A5N6SJ62_ASPPS|nr:uncharacterized protein BDV38DRAFT_274004 [Aspergillus pseudotamarii]KAE8133790.1 hypothetical protein BDV38DRAFT_274004 [Aspergillus pseudotamarii]
MRKNGVDGKHRDEMHTDVRTLEVEFEHFFGIVPSKINRRFPLSLSEQSYLPKVENPRADWAVVAAFNSFQAYQRGQLGKVQRFATIGTGSGTDMIAALETFPDLEFGAMTDLHTSVVSAAKRNVLNATDNYAPCRAVAKGIYAAAGDLLLPLRDQEAFDLIYENLPNIPLPTTKSLVDGQISSTFIGDRTADRVPVHVSQALLDLHYICLYQARVMRLIKSSGAILSSMGGRVPVQSMLDMADAAGYSSRVVSLTWKIQSEPETVIGEYAENQKKGLGKYYFYPTSALGTAFGDLSPAAAGLRAAQIEQNLHPHRLDAVAALEQYHAGVEIGHTVYVMASVLKESPSVV